MSGVVLGQPTKETQEETTTTTCAALSSPIKTVLVTGSNGFVGSWIVKELLEQGYNVHACVRDASDPTKVEHLLRLVQNNQEELPNNQNCVNDSSPLVGRLRLFSTGDLGKTDPSVWDDPLKDCDAVMHTSMALDWTNGKHGMYHPTLKGTQNLLDAIERHTTTVKTLILTSSMAAVATQTNGGMTDVFHWRNVQEEKLRGSWYSATKTAQEELAFDWFEQKRQEGRLPQDFRFVSICPTRILGPPIHPSVPVSGWLSHLDQWLQEGTDKESPNETLALVHPQDVARMHIVALDDSKNAMGRYLCTDESWHWNDVMEYLYPDQKSLLRLYDGNDKVPLPQFNQERRQSLGVELRPMAQILDESIEYIKSLHR